MNIPSLQKETLPEEKNIFEKCMPSYIQTALILVQQSWLAIRLNISLRESNLQVLFKAV